MSQFSETLTRLMRQKHLKSVELCEILSIRKSRFSKIKNGGILPTDFSLVEQLAKAMNLNPQEEKELYLSYQMSKFGHTYEQIEASMKRLYEVECPQYYQKEECLDTPVSAENGHLYTNKMAVLAAVQRLCLNTASVRIAIQPEDQDLLEILGRCVASCGDTVPLQCCSGWNLLTAAFRRQIWTYFRKLCQSSVRGVWKFDVLMELCRSCWSSICSPTLL